MQYKAQVSWKRETPTFDAKTYDRTHHLQFGGGVKLDASSAPEFLGKKELPNPEELFTASIASCFMLTFLYWAAVKGLVIDDYSMEAVGTLAKNAEGKMAMTEVVLKPSVKFHENKMPEAGVLDELFKKAHDQCFISSSVKTKVTVQAEQAVA